MAEIGLIGLAVMGQNLALNIAEKGFSISVYNRSFGKTEATVARAKKENLGDKLTGYKDLKEFVNSLKKPRNVILLIKAGKPVDDNIAALKELLEPDDLIIDGGNEWYQNTERRAAALTEQKIHYMGMGVSGGEDGARNGPSLMPGGPKAAYDRVSHILKKIAAQVNDGPCVFWIGPRGAGNYVKMVHNGIEYGDMQLIAEAYDVLKNIGGLSNDELHKVFADWNTTELESFLIEITAHIFKTKYPDKGTYVVDNILDKTGMKGTGRWTVQEAAEQSVPAPTINAALDARYLSGLKEERLVAAGVLKGPEAKSADDKDKVVNTVKQALYAAKICSYAQGMNLIRAAGKANDWPLDLGEIARIWKGGCIIRAKFLDRIKAAYVNNKDIPSLLMDPDFAKEMNDRQQAMRDVVTMSIQAGIAVPAFSGSLAYFDAYRRQRLPANLTQAQRDFFGAHKFEQVDKPDEEPVHYEWQQ